MKTSNYFDKEFALYDDENNRYRLANNILYKIVKDHPGNKNHDEIVTKCWIIGRTYAAAIERRPNKDDTPGDFYYKYVAPKIAKSNLDKMINKIKRKKYQEINEAALKDILDIHAYLVGLIKGITKREKRSFASKYLHFHLPDLVFIYDSRVSSVIGKFVDGKIKSSSLKESWDKTYATFAYKAFEIYKSLKKRNYVSRYDTLPRVIDNFLLRYCDDNNIKIKEEN